MPKLPRIVKYLIALISISVLAIALLFAAWWQNPRMLTALFFGVNTSPVPITIAPNHPPRKSDAKTAAIVIAANHFLNSLDATQRQAVMYAFNDNAQRANWSNFPEGMIPRGGLKLGALNIQQRKNLRAILREIMSELGTRNITHQLISEDTLAPSNLMKYGTRYYYVAFLGKPSTTLPWMLQFGGHHLAINATIYGNARSLSPMLTGGQPLRIRPHGDNSAEIFITENEIAAAHALFQSLSARQQKIATRALTPINLHAGPGEFGKPITPEGIIGNDLTRHQKNLLLTLIQTRLNFLNPTDRNAKMATARAELNNTHFGWWGPPTGDAYYRITAPSLLLEYSPQGANHAHAIYRNPKNDYAAALIGAN